MNSRKSTTFKTYYILENTNLPGNLAPDFPTNI